MAEEIWTIDDKKKYKFLRKKTTDFNFKKFTKPQIAALIKNMRAIMRKANGIGLSANQIGLNLNMFVAEVPDAQGGTKFRERRKSNLRRRMPEHPGRVGRRAARGESRHRRLRQERKSDQDKGVGAPRAGVPARDRPLERQALH